MNKIKFLLNGAAAVALALSVSACGGDDEDEPKAPDTDIENGDWSGNVSSGDKITTDEQAKEFLGQTASLVMDQFTPADQKPLVDLAASFANDYSDYGFDTSAFEGRAVKARALNKFFNSLRVAATGRYMDFSRAAVTIVEIAPFKGIYRPDATRKMFYRAADSDNVEVEFYHDGKPCKLVVTPSADTWSVTADADTAKYTAKIPSEIRFSLTDGGAKLVEGTAKTYWKDGDALRMAADVTAMNIRAASSVNATNSVVTTTDELYIDGSMLARAEGVVNGTNMVSTKALEGIFDKEVDSWEYWNGYEYVTETEYYYEFNPSKASKMFKNGNASAQLMDRVLVRAEVSNAAKLFALDELYFDTDDYDSKAKAECQKACDVLNSNTEAYVFLAGNSKSTAKLKWQPYLDYESNWDDYSYQAWVPEGVISFADGSTYNVSQYVIGDFGNVLNRFESLYYAYERMFEAAF